VDESHGSSEALRLRLLWWPGEDSLLGSTRDCLLEFARELGTVRTRPLRDLGDPGPNGGRVLLGLFLEY